MLKKLFSLAAAAMAVFLFLGASAEAASWDLTGEAWKASSTQEKRAVIYGASNIIALEKKLAEEGGRKASVFVENWMRVFKDKTYASICSEIDSWFAAHPGELQRNVFDVIWYELIGGRPAAKK
ncbi:MAG: hypothetical protein IKX79_03000 [Desulfovibrionaceae bacterium]|nr:hypothetical protein [Desulfovibrionaceae bacterium]MBR5734496.1 hypothetical protein [Desulfovibrionaceae bacterium]